MTMFNNEVDTITKELGYKYNSPEILQLIRFAPGATQSLLIVEQLWFDKKRPYFNVYPKILEALSRTSLNVQPDQIPNSVINDLGVMALKLPVNHNVKLLQGISTIFLSRVDEFLGAKRKGFSKQGWSLYYRKDGAVYYLATPDNKSVLEATEISQKPDELELIFATQSDEERARTAIATRIVIGVMMLASDQKFVEPILLQRDSGKAKTPADVDRLKEKAHRRGLVGYNLGKHVEMSPHVRVPHFAIRWTGPGAAVPRLTPISGSIVNSKLLHDIPTGYESEEAVSDGKNT